MESEIPTNWIKQGNFVFAASLAYLKSRVDNQDNPTTLVAQYHLFKKLDDETALVKVDKKLEAHIAALAPLKDSGFQAGDCFTVTSYALFNDWHSINPDKFNSLVMSRLEVAALSNWFDDPELASLVLQILPNENHLHSKAQNYFTKNIQTWLKKKHLLGIIFYALRFREEDDAYTQASEHMEKVNWAEQDIRLQSLALTYFQQTNHTNITIQNTLATLIYNKLNSSQAIAKIIYLLSDSQEKSNHTDPSTMTDYEIAIALTALHQASFDKIIGFRNPKSIEFETLMNHQNRVQKDGVYITVGYIRFYEASVFIALIAILILLVKVVSVPDIGSVAGAVVEIIVAAVLFILGGVLVRRIRPSEIITKEIFGIESAKDE